MERKYYDLTNPQQSIWLTEQFYKDTAINHICGTVLLHEVVDFDLLKKAIETFGLHPGRRVHWRRLLRHDLGG